MSVVSELGEIFPERVPYYLSSHGEGVGGDGIDIGTRHTQLARPGEISIGARLTLHSGEQKTC